MDTSIHESLKLPIPALMPLLERLEILLYCHLSNAPTPTKSPQILAKLT